MPAMDMPIDRPRPAPVRTHLTYHLQSLRDPTSAITVVHLAGEIDTASLPHVETALSAALVRGSDAVVVDVAGLTFCDVGGLHLLAHPPHGAAAGASTTRRSRDSGQDSGPANRSGGERDYAVAGLTPMLQRVATLLWRSDQPARYPSTSAAVTALRAAHTAARAATPA